MRINMVGTIVRDCGGPKYLAKRLEYASGTAVCSNWKGRHSGIPFARRRKVLDILRETREPTENELRYLTATRRNR